MARTPSTMLPLGTPMPAFTLPDVVSGDAVSSHEIAGAPASVVVFWCNHCPFVKHIAPRFVDFARGAMERGVKVVAISSNDAAAYPDDGPEAMAELATADGYPFAYLYDESQTVAKAFSAACTPDFYLFDGEGELAYRGQFDGSRPGNAVPVTGEDLAAALERVLAGEAVGDDQVPSLGCNIKWKPGNAPAYYGG
ncbi:thioredoxin family protein [Gemmatimonadota bacterium Y43]|uniref:thioredoxin family protein n=1 Tax=Gaopeijia maritima TaxID=3119007 RepID=UPI0032778FA3